MANTYLTRTNSGTGSETKGTYSAWIKRSKLGGASDYLWHTSEDTNNDIKILTNSSDSIRVRGINNGSAIVNLIPNKLFKDVSGWYHLVVAFDTTQATEADRVKMYVNGVQITSFSTATYPSQNLNLKLNQSGDRRTIGTAYDNGGSPSAAYWNGLMTQVIWVDGTAYAPSTFGSVNATSGIWVGNTSPTVTYGTNGYNLDMANSSDMGNDVSGNANDFTVSGTLTQAKDCPSNVFATMNRESPTTVALADMANGNLYNGDQSPNKWQGIPGTLAAEKGKIYWEVKIENVWGNTSQNSQRHGIGNIAAAVDNNTSDAYDIQWTSAAYGIGWCNSSGVRNSGSVTGTGNYSTFVATNILMFAMDLDNLKLYLGKNGVWEYSGDPTSGASGTGAYTIPAAGMWAPYSETRYGSDTISWNIGNGYFRTVAVSSAGTNASANGIFEYDVPTGYTAISTKGLNI